MRVLDKLKEVTLVLAESGIEDAAKDAEILITEALHIDRTTFYGQNPSLTQESSGQIDALVCRRTKGEPLQYVVGHVEFGGLTLKIGPGVLIPRPETELLVEEAIKQISQQSGIRNQGSEEGLPLRILDLCTGSGCIALALSKSFPQALVYGVDRSTEAIGYASQNASLNGAKNIRFIVGDLFECLGAVRFQCIVSNPPYIKRSEILRLQREIREYEPIEALDGGEDGLDFYRRILASAPRYLAKDGAVLLETGYDQKDEVEKIGFAEGFRDIRFVQDYAGLWRIFCAKSPQRDDLPRHRQKCNRCGCQT